MGTTVDTLCYHKVLEITKKLAAGELLRDGRAYLRFTLGDEYRPFLMLSLAGLDLFALRALLYSSDCNDGIHDETRLPWAHRT